VAFDENIVIALIFLFLYLQKFLLQNYHICDIFIKTNEGGLAVLWIIVTKRNIRRKGVRRIILTVGQSARISQ
jgi:hypothetical protein